MNGSVTPVKGITRATTAILTNAWNVSQLVIPTATSAAKGSGDRDAIR